MSFRTRLVRPEGVGTWTFAEVPKKVSEKAGLRTHQRIVGTIDGVEFSSSLMPRGGGVFYLVVKGELRAKLGKQAGEAVDVVMELDSKPVTIAVPPALKEALERDLVSKKKFESLAPSHRKAFSSWVTEAKKEETRARRVSAALKMLQKGETLN